MTPDRSSVNARMLLVGLCLMMLSMPGCRGCIDSRTPEERAAAEKKVEEERKRKKEEKKKKKKPPMEVGPLNTLPSQAGQPLVYAKPGHWVTLSQPMKRNYDEWVGETRRGAVDRNGQPVRLDRTRFTIESQRPVALSKGQQREVDSVVFVPGDYASTNVRWRVSGRDAVSAEFEDFASTTGLLPHQYNILVLAANPESYGRLRSLRSVNAPVLALEADTQFTPGFYPPRLQYRVVTPKLGDRAPLPDSLFCLTSYAYLFWDEANPETLDPAQRDALVDWLHWGGQLIVSGPDSLALLKGSFLEPYLPAEGGEAWDINTQDLQPMLSTYSAGQQGPKFKLTRPWSGVRLKVVEDQATRVRSDNPVARATAQLNCGALFAERRVGRGRVLVSAMQLNQRGLQNWENGFECLMNAVVFRRPPRRFRKSNFMSNDPEDGFDYSEEQVSVEWLRGDRYLIDAALNSKFRLFARDTYEDNNVWRYTRNESSRSGMNRQQPVDQYLFLPPRFAGGVGGWNDFSQASNAARETLREAAGVTVPGSSFVVACVGLYLVVIAPMNWMFFKAMGRVEYAWIAAPLIAIIGTVVVVKQAQLDIGFVRAQTEVALLETQPNYPRGCLTRFTGVYTSLATNYDITFEDPNAVAAPFALKTNFTMLPGQRVSQVAYDRQDKARLLGLDVSSASTEMIHSEEMHNAGAAVRLGESSGGLLQIENPTEWDLRHVVVVYRPEKEKPGREDATLMGCWIGELPKRGSATLSWSLVPMEEDAAPYAQNRRADGAEALNLEPLWRAALDPGQFEPGEYRCVARIDQSLPGMTVSPKAAQQTGMTLLVTHLQYDIPPAPESDANAPVDFKDQR